MNKLFRYSALFLSYTPLWLSIVFMDVMSLFIDHSENPWTERLSLVVLFCLCLISVVNFILTFHGFSKENSSMCIIRNAQEDKNITMEYLLSFILPMLAFDFTLWRQMFLFLIYFLTLIVLCARHDLITANIVIELTGYKLYHVKAENSDGKQIDREVISRKPLMSWINENIYLYPINDNLYYDVTNKKKYGGVSS